MQKKKIYIYIYISLTLVPSLGLIVQFFDQFQKSVFFDKKNLDLIGWETKDIYQNIVQTFISNVQKNIAVDNKIFMIQKYIN